MRWVTHLCAPSFVLLMGAAAALRHARKPDETWHFLLTRGLWLILLEVTWITFSWDWNIQNTYLGVLWALGGAMVLLAPASRLPGRAVLGLGVVLTLGMYAARSPELLPAVEVLLVPGGITVFGHRIGAAYPLLPWFALAAIGWGLGPWLTRASRRAMASGGAALIGVFVVVRLAQIGDPSPWEAHSRGAVFTALDFVDLTKYPPSPSFLLLMVGLGFLVMAAAQGRSGPFARGLQVFGRVPMFFYLVHLPFAHLLADGWHMVVHGSVDRPAGEGLEPLGIVVFWLLLTAALFPACVAWDRLKRRRRDLWWLRYL